jgi:hypothetical protein
VIYCQGIVQIKTFPKADHYKLWILLSILIIVFLAVVALAEKVGLTTVPGTEPRIKAIFQAHKDGKTSIDGIWAAGTYAGVSVHTIITAGDGAKVAINIISELNGERYVDHDVLK